MKKDYKEVFDIMRTLSNLNTKEIELLFSALQLYCITQHVDNNKVEIPYIGTLFVNNEGDSIENGKRKSNFNTTFILDPSFKENMEYAEDLKNHNISITEIPSLRELINNISKFVKFTSK